jgi:hypothetical protein
VPKQQTRVQQRRIKPKQRQAQFQPPPPPAKGANRALQARMLEGYSPQSVIRISLYLAIFQVVLLLIGAGLFLLFQDLPLKLEAALVLVAAAILPGTLVWPALVLALRDRKATPELVQGQMISAAPVSTVYGLGMLQIRTRQKDVYLNIERRLLKMIPQNQVQVASRVTPNLRHVASLQVIGPRMGGNIPAEVPEQFRWAERFPLLALGLTYVAVFGLGLLVLALPLYGSLLWLHLLLVPAVMALGAVTARFAISFFQKRLEARLQPEG